MTLSRHSLVSDVIAYVDEDGVKLFREDETGPEQVDGALARMEGHNVVTGLALTPDEEFLVSVSWDKNLMVWSLKNHSHVRTVESGHTKEINCVSVSPDGLRMVTGSSDTTLKVFVFGSGECVMTLTEHTDYVQSCEYSSDGLFIVSGSRDMTVKVWNAQTGEQKFITIDQTPLPLLNTRRPRR